MICLTGPEINFAKDYQVYQITGRLKNIGMITETETILRFESKATNSVSIREDTSIHLGVISIEDAELRRDFDLKIAGDSLIKMCRTMVPNTFPKESTTEVPFDAALIENIFRKNLEEKECPIITAQCIHVNDDFFVFRLIRRKTKWEEKYDQENSINEVKFSDVYPQNVRITFNGFGEYILSVQDQDRKLYVMLKGGESTALALHFVCKEIPKYFSSPIRILYREDPEDIDSYEFLGIQERNLDVIPTTMKELSELPGSDILQLQDFVIGNITSYFIKNPYSKKSRKLTIECITRDGKHIEFYSRNEGLIKYFNRKTIQIDINTRRWIIYYDKNDFRITALSPVKRS